MDLSEAGGAVSLLRDRDSELVPSAVGRACDSDFCRVDVRYGLCAGKAVMGGKSGGSAAGGGACGGLESGMLVCFPARRGNDKVPGSRDERAALARAECQLGREAGGC